MPMIYIQNIKIFVFCLWQLIQHMSVQIYHCGLEREKGEKKEKNATQKK